MNHQVDKAAVMQYDSQKIMRNFHTRGRVVKVGCKVKTKIERKDTGSGRDSITPQ